MLDIGMLNDTLSSNEIKNSAGTGVAFTRQRIADRETYFAQTGTEGTALLHRLSIKHTETGAGFNRRRRSVVRIDKTSISLVDDVTPITTSAYVVLDAPVGANETTAEMATVLAELNSFMASLGASTTILYDGSGNGSQVLINGGL